MTMSEQLWRVGAVLLIAFGFVMVLGFSMQIMEGTSSYALQTDLVLVLALGGVPIGSGVWLIRRLRKVVAARDRAGREKVVLQLAAGRQGVLTVPEVAAHSALTLEQAKETLDELNLKGVNQMDVSDAGIIVYRFPSALP